MSCDSRWLSLMHTDMLKCVRGIIPARWSWWSFEFFTRIFQSKSVLLDLLRFLFEVYNEVFFIMYSVGFCGVNEKSSAVKLGNSRGFI